MKYEPRIISAHPHERQKEFSKLLSELPTIIPPSDFAELEAIALTYEIKGGVEQLKKHCIRDFDFASMESVLTNSIPDPKWIIPSLEIGPGRPCGIHGGGGAGKSWVALDIAISVASGTNALSLFCTKQTKVLYLNYEMQQSTISRRLRRLANDKGLSPEIMQNLVTANMPNSFLTDDNSEEMWSRSFVNFGLVIIDSLRRTATGIDENDSRIAQQLDKLTRISERTGATILLVHHAGKNKNAGSTMVGRGSSAITDGSSCIWVLEKKEPNTLLYQSRAHDDGDGKKQDQYLIKMEHTNATQLYQINNTSVRFVAESVNKIKAVAERTNDLTFDLSIRKMLLANPGIKLTKLRELIGGDFHKVSARVKEMKNTGYIREEREGRGSKLFYIEQSTTEVN